MANELANQVLNPVQSAEWPTGYFRIGHIVLDVPPTNISTNKVINDDQVATLRGGTPMFVKTGQSRWDVTVQWKAVRTLNVDGSYDYSQWNKLRVLVAIFHATPFVEVENQFLRQHFANIQKGYETQRMAFAMKQLRVDTDPNTTNVINVVLTMSLFNYAPFSKDFGYVGNLDADSVDATASLKYSSFIDNWIQKNMTVKNVGTTSPNIADWEYQGDGVITMKWRNYNYVAFDGKTLPATSRASSNIVPTQPSQRISKRVMKGTLSDDIRQLIDTSAKKYGLDPAIVEAQCLFESNGNPNAISRTGAVGLLQILPSTANKSIQQLLDPAVNVDFGCKYLAEQLTKFGNYSHALGAYNAGAGYIYAYRDGKTVYPSKGHRGNPINLERVKTWDGLPPAGIPHGENTPKYVQTILANSKRMDQYKAQPPVSSDGNPPSTPQSTALVDVPDQRFASLVQKAISQLPSTGKPWYLDHYTEVGAFFFQENEMTVSSGDSDVESDFDMFPTQMSVVLVNNLPLIPLAGMQYPTFQHVGPTDTMISLSFDSVGTEDTHLSEPEHPGIETMAAMISQLESQFHDLRATFRAVSSIHRMQAVFIENRLLNLLGITGTMIRGLTTDTVPDSANQAQVTLLASQYDNVFEETGPFQMNGISSVNKKPLADLLKSGVISTLSQSEQEAMRQLKEFGESWRNRDTQYLVAQIFKITSQPLDPLSSMIVDSAHLRPDQKDALLGNLDMSATGSVTAPGFFGKAAQVLVPNKFLGDSGGLKYQSDVYPGLQKRRLKLSTSAGNMTYADYLVFTSLPVVSDRTVINNTRSSVEAAFASKKATIIDSMYQSLFDWMILTEPTFNRQAQLITNSPNFKDKFNPGVSAEGPATQRDSNNHPINPNRGCYRDLGIGNDYNANPGGYFVDYNLQLTKDMDEELINIMGTANQMAGQVNQQQNVSGKSVSDPDSITFIGNDQGLPGAANSLIRMKNVPAYSMNSAFPTFKLLLLEEDNTGPYFAFDNFYSYASVKDIEIIKYRDKPDTAIIEITNLAHLLQHRLYDDSAAGRMERSADKWNVAPDGSLIRGGPGVEAGEVGTGGNPASGITAAKTAAGVDYQTWMNKDLTEGPTSAIGRVPLKFYALQTGSKIQVRLGYSNNPDMLFPVFTGIITQIDGDEILTITCQSFMLELMQTPGTTVNRNGRFGFNAFSGGAAYGGWSLTSSGDTLNVVKDMLKSPAAKHFGHWQVNSIKSPKMKGFEWSELIGEAMEKASNKTVSAIGSLLQTGYDRSGENILTQSVINIDASKQNGPKANDVRASYYQENPNLLFGTARYGIDKQSKRSIWEIIRDITRRYPFFNLMVKDYGFPFEADATIVFAHPHDWYYSRPALYGDAEKEVINNQKHAAQFKAWWDGVGKAKWNRIWSDFRGNQVTAGIFGAPVTRAVLNAQQSMTDLSGEGPNQFSDAIDHMHGVLLGSPSITLDSGRPWLQKLYDIEVAVANYGNLSQGIFKNFDNEFQALYREWLIYLTTADPAANNSRLRPVRKYHLIDHNHIIHNTMSVDDNIYNGVKIGTLAPIFVNQNIPEQHQRVLDATDMIEDIDNNVMMGFSEPLAAAYAQSFLRDEVGKMYRGELILRGVPEIEPYDIILMNDISTGIIGPVEVDTVIHSFNLENGFITIVKPRLMVLINEGVSTNIIQNLSLAWAHGLSNLRDLKMVFNPFNKDVTIGAQIAEFASAGGALAVGISLVAWAPPVGITIAALGLLVAGGLIVFAGGKQTDNLFKLMPLSRFGRPWLGGLQGFDIGNFAYNVQTWFRWFDAEEIYPTMESWREFLNYQMDYLPPSP